MAHIQGIDDEEEDGAWVAAEAGFSDEEDPPAVPEPASFALLGAGALVLVARRYFARK